LTHSAYLTDAANPFGGNTELTSELLADALQLAHPDRHPPERQELAHRTTQALLAIQPFVFPAPKPKPQPKPQPQSREKDDKLSKAISKLNAYPCPECASTVPLYYCTGCKAEYDKRNKDEHDKRTAKQRAEYARRRQRKLSRQKPKQCASCGKEFDYNI
jgi:hypothetical protein